MMRANRLEIEVDNLWPNRLIGDATLPREKRMTITNVRTYDTMASGTYGCQQCQQRKKTGKPAELLPSGLLGPVRMMAQEEIDPEREIPGGPQARRPLDCRLEPQYCQLHPP